MTSKRKLRRQRNQARLRAARLEMFLNEAPTFETLEVNWSARSVLWRGHTIMATEAPILAMPILVRDMP